jgi:Metallo-beta-lactamase superfamily
VEEIAPGIWHWTVFHPGIKLDVSSYCLPAERVLIDPMAPGDGLEWFANHGPPTDVLLTNRHHYRSSAQFAERFGVTVHCVREGMHEFSDAVRVEAFDFGDELPGGIVAHAVGAICPDETALYIPARSALALADGAVRWEAGGALAFVPDAFMDDPEETKDGLRESYRRLAELDFQHLLLAHGEPFVGMGREILAAFAR